MYPVTWHEHDESRWWMLLRCGACDRRYDAIVTDKRAEEFDAKLYCDQYWIARAADQLHREWRSADAR